MTEWSRPRTTPMAGRRKATLSYCNPCGQFHRTHRHPEGLEICPVERVEIDTMPFPAVIGLNPNAKRQSY